MVAFHGRLEALSQTIVVNGDAFEIIMYVTSELVISEIAANHNF